MANNKEHDVDALLTKINLLNVAIRTERARNRSVQRHLEIVTGALMTARNAAEDAAKQMWNATAALGNMQEKHAKVLADLDKSKDLLP